MKKILNKLFLQKGIAAILTIIIVGMSALTMVITASLLGLGELDMGNYSDKGKEALQMAAGCVEEALEQIKLDNAFSAADYSLSMGGGSCIINVSVSGEERTITAEGTKDNHVKRMKAEVKLVGNKIFLNKLSEE